MSGRCFFFPGTLSYSSDIVISFCFLQRHCNLVLMTFKPMNPFSQQWSISNPSNLHGRITFHYDYHPKAQIHNLTFLIQGLPNAKEKSVSVECVIFRKYIWVYSYTYNILSDGLPPPRWAVSFLFHQQASGHFQGLQVARRLQFSLPGKLNIFLSLHLIHHPSLNWNFNFYFLCEDFLCNLKVFSPSYLQPHLLLALIMLAQCNH